VKSLTPEAMAALHDVDAEMATDFAKKFIAQALTDPHAMSNLYASGLLGRPGEAWSVEVRNRIGAFIAFACTECEFDRGFERGSNTEALIKAWLDVVKPSTEDMSYLLLLGEDNNVALKEFFIELGADPHLPIIRNLKHPGTNKESYACVLMAITDGMPTHLQTILAEPPDDLPVSMSRISTDGEPDLPRSLLDVAILQEDCAALKVILGSRDIASPKVAQRMSDSLSHAISKDRNFWAMQLVGVGASPADGNWEPIVSYFSEKKPGAQEPRFMEDFSVEAGDERHITYGGRPIILLALERLVQHGMDINICDDQSHGMVYYAAHYGHMRTLQTLLELGADYRGVLASYDADKRTGPGIPEEDEQPSENGRQMLLAWAARQAMDGVVQQAKNNIGKDVT
jgi:hypothetical protein